MFGRLMNLEGGLFDDLWRMQEEVEKLLGRSSWPIGIRSVARGTFPAVNVGATPENVNVYVFAAGMDPKSLDVSIQQNLLTISGTRSLPVSETASYYRQERFGGEFRRVIGLPDDVDPDRVDAKYRDGVLHIRVPRREAVKARQIQIN